MNATPRFDTTQQEDRFDDKMRAGALDGRPLPCRMNKNARFVFE